MKTKNTRVRVRDIKQGVMIHTAHPVYGISSYLVVSRPYMVEGIGLFMKVKRKCSIYGKTYVTERSLNDAGITPGNSYNGRRTFFKLKHAEAWVKKWGTDIGFIKSHTEHERRYSVF